jgi:hypothetical protein
VGIGLFAVHIDLVWVIFAGFDAEKIPVLDEVAIDDGCEVDLALE